MKSELNTLPAIPITRDDQILWNQSVKAASMLYHWRLVDIFDCPCYLFFVTPISSNSFERSLNNEDREILRFGEHEEDEGTLLQTYSFDDYDFNEIRGHIEKYLTDEVSYLHKNFKVRVEEWED